MFYLISSRNSHAPGTRVVIVPVIYVRDVLVIRMQVSLTISEAHSTVKHGVLHARRKLAAVIRQRDRVPWADYFAAATELTVRVLPFRSPLTTAFCPASAPSSVLMPSRM